MTTYATSFVWVALLVLGAWACGGDESSPGDVPISAACLGATVCASQVDCAGGERCNTTLVPPKCQKLYCSDVGESCDPTAGDTLCKTGMFCLDTNPPKCASCKPDCEGKVCGDDGCRGSCGACPGSGDVCWGGACCTPVCDGKECGTDGCGGNCGACEEGWKCSSSWVCEVDHSTDLTGMGWRFDMLVETSPITGLIGDQLNKYFVDNIATDVFNVLLLATADDRDAGTLTFTVGAGTEGEDSYKLNAGAGNLVCTLSGARFTTATPVALSLPNDMFTPPVLPLQHVKLSGLFAADVTSIAEGLLTGALTEADAGTIKVEGAALPWMLNALNVDKDLDLDGDGTNDAWSFEFAYTAEAADVTE